MITTYGPFAAYTLKLFLLAKKIKHDPATQSYMDIALTPVDDHGEDEHLEMFELSESAKAAVAKAHKETEARESRQQAKQVTEAEQAKQVTAAE